MDKISVAWNGVNEAYIPLSPAEKQAVREEITAGAPYFVYVGSLHPRKNIIRLLQAYDEYRKTGGNYAMVIAGGAYWWNKKMDSEFNKLAYGKEVIFTGHLPLERLTKVIGGANALTYVSYFEGFGIPLVEAMRCGVPVIAAKATSLPEVGGDAALYCDPLDIKDITNALIQMSNSHDARQKVF
jgi:glycosyltransferase involved in cell wall biosynthesis